MGEEEGEGSEEIVGASSALQRGNTEVIRLSHSGGGHMSRLATTPFAFSR